MASRERYVISAQSLPELVTQLNFILSRVSERLDQNEGVAGTATVQEGLTVKGTDLEIIHGFNTEDEV